MPPEHAHHPNNHTRAPSTDADDDESPRPARNKGKARAISPSPSEPSEHTPLLGSSSSPPPTVAPPRRRRSLPARLALVFLLSLSASVLLLVGLALLAYSYAARAARTSSDELIARALVVRGPSHVRVLNATTGDGEGGDGQQEVWLELEGLVGVDAGAALGVNSERDGDATDPFGTYVWKALGRWGVGSLGALSVDVGVLSIIDSAAGARLVEVLVPPLVLPLSTDPPAGDGWLTPVSIPLRVRPTRDGDALVRFARTSWCDGALAVRVHVPRATVRGGGLGGGGWRGLLRMERADVQVPIRKKIPALPGMPAPGRDAPLPDLARLVTLTDFSLTSASDALLISARASAVNPIPDTVNITGSVPGLPWLVSLPLGSDDDDAEGDTNSANATSVPLAAVRSAPFSLTRPNISIALAGSVLPLPSSDETPSPGARAFSHFLSTYLSGLPSSIQISSPLLPHTHLAAQFPAPDPKPHVLRQVALRDMRLRAVGANGAVVASGTVHARVVLPHGMDVKMDVGLVWPDVLVFDGKVPQEGEEEPEDEDGETLVLQLGAWPWGGWPPRPGPGPGPPSTPSPPPPPPPDAPPLPDPLPPRAFAHIRPPAWLPAESEPFDAGEGDGAAVEVTARFVDVPLERLPGRDKEFGDFVGKVVFGSNGALAGLRGTVDVAVQVRGLGGPNGSAESGMLELDGLPFEGEVRIGKKGL